MSAFLPLLFAGHAATGYRYRGHHSACRQALKKAPPPSNSLRLSSSCKLIYCLSKPMTEKSIAPRKLLVAIASFGTGGNKFLEQLIAQYQAMPLDVDVVVLSNINKTLPPGVELLVGMPTNDPWSLPFAHKKLFVDRANDYDLFIYSENDTPITLRNIEAFLEVSEVLPENEIAGFFRYEASSLGVRNYINLHGHYHWDPTSVCRRGPYVFASLTNEHSACYLLTQRQLRRAIDSGGFLTAPHQGKYDLACTAATDPYTVCGFRKLVCISRLEDFLVRHLPDKYTPDGFSKHEQEFDRQIQALLEIGDCKRVSVPLLQAETRLPAAWYSKEYDEALRTEAVTLLPSSVRTVLSVGAGTGKTEKFWSKNGLRVTAIPLDSVIGATLEGGEIQVVHGGLAESIEALHDRKFDCVYLSNVLHLMPDPQRILNDLARLLAPGGCVLIITPNMNTLKNFVNRALSKPGFRELGNFELSGAQFVSPGVLKRWLKNAGCRLEHIKWMARPRFAKFIKLNAGIFGPLFGHEVIALARKN